MSVFLMTRNNMSFNISSDNQVLYACIKAMLFLIFTVQIELILSLYSDFSHLLKYDKNH
jgi:hypothetical protein